MAKVELLAPRALPFHPAVHVLSGSSVFHGLCGAPSSTFTKALSPPLKILGDISVS